MQVKPLAMDWCHWSGCEYRAWHRDALLARVLVLIDAAAQKEGRRFFGCDGYSDQAARDFIAGNSR